MMTKRPLALLAAAGMLPILTATVRAGEEETADLARLPAAVQKTARQEVGSAKVEEIEETFEDGQHATEVEYRAGGHKMAVVIARDGTLIQKENRLSPGDAPEAIRKAVAVQFADGRISHIKEVERKDAKFFEVAIKTSGKARQLKLDRDGKPVK